MSFDKIGLIAGDGRFPVLVAQNAKRHGLKVIAAGFNGKVDPLLRDSVAELQLFQFCLVGAIIRYFKSRDIKKTITIGTIAQTMFHDGNLQFDDAATMIWNKMKDRRTNSMMATVVDLLADHGIEVLDSTLYLKQNLAPEGVMTARQPSETEWKDIRLGYRMAKAIGGLDIGQTIVVRNGSILAVEALEGTDQTIARVARLAEPGAVVVKVAKPRQDMRFDVPAAGVRTLESMVNAGAACLAIEAGKVLIEDSAALVKKADQHNIAVLGITKAIYKE